MGIVDAPTPVVDQTGLMHAPPVPAPALEYMADEPDEDDDADDDE